MAVREGFEALLSHEFKTDLVIAFAYETMFENIWMAIGFLTIYKLSYNWVLSAFFVFTGIIASASCKMSIEQTPSAAFISTNVLAMLLFLGIICSFLIDQEL